MKEHKQQPQPTSRTPQSAPRAANQAPAEDVLQRYAQPDRESKSENRTGIPDDMKMGFENLSGHSFDNVRVHYNSTKPAQLQAHAYAQGNEVYLGPGQERHLGHELGHVVQQKQGRVRPTAQMKGMNINDDAKLEAQADQINRETAGKVENSDVSALPMQMKANGSVVQMKKEKGYFYPSSERCPHIHFYGKYLNDGFGVTFGHRGGSDHVTVCRESNGINSGAEIRATNSLSNYSDILNKLNAAIAKIRSGNGNDKVSSFL